MVTRDEIDDLSKKLNSMDEAFLRKLAKSYLEGSTFDLLDDPSCPLSEYELYICVKYICKPFFEALDNVFNQLNGDCVCKLAHLGRSNGELDTLRELPELPKLQRFAEDML